MFALPHRRLLALLAAATSTAAVAACGLDLFAVSDVPPADAGRDSPPLTDTSLPPRPDVETDVGPPDGDPPDAEDADAPTDARDSGDASDAGDSRDADSGADSGALPRPLVEYNLDVLTTTTANTGSLSAVAPVGTLVTAGSGGSLVPRDIQGAFLCPDMRSPLAPFAPDSIACSAWGFSNDPRAIDMNTDLALPTRFSVTGWLYQGGFRTTSSRVIALEGDPGDDTSVGFEIVVRLDGTLRVGLGGRNDGAGAAGDWGGLTPLIWYYVAVTFDGAQVCYYRGTLGSEVSQVGCKATARTLPTTLVQPRLTVGNFAKNDMLRQSTSDSRTFSGRMDQVRVFGVALPLAAIKAYQLR